MDAAALIQQLQADHAAVQGQLTSTRDTLQTVVAEYEALEGDYTKLQQASEVLKAAFVSTSRVFFGGIRALWDDTCAKGPVGPDAQSCLTAALAHLDKVQRQLVAAGLADVAAAASVEDSEELMKAAAASTVDEMRAQEREMLLGAVAEVHARAAGLEEQLSARAQELAAAREAAARAEAELAAVKAAATAAAASSAAGGAPGVIQVGEVRYDAPALSRLLARAASLEGQVGDLGRALSAAQASADSAREEAASSAARALHSSAIREAESHASALRIQLESALRRAADAELRCERLVHERGSAEMGASKRDAELRSTIHGLETSNAALSRSLATVRLELEGLQDRYSAQSSVLDMLRGELADKEAALAKAAVTKQALAARAAAALREVEGQVAQLTSAVASLQAQKRAQGQVQVQGLQ